MHPHAFYLVLFYAEPRKTIQYETYTDDQIAELYEQAVAEDDWIDTKTRLYWETPEVIAELGKLATQDQITIAARRAGAWYRAYTGHMYRLSLLQ